MEIMGETNIHILYLPDITGLVDFFVNMRTIYIYAKKKIIPHSYNSKA